MKIYITLGQRLDGALWSNTEASLGKLTLGLNGMISFLEGRLGLSGASISQTERINVYRQKCERYFEMEKATGKENSEIFGAESFQLDPWSTTKQLLAWRDELIEGLWSPQQGTGGGKRLEMLAALEMIPIKLPLGNSDRLRAILNELRQKQFPLNYSLEITLHEPLSLFPVIWQNILEQLKLFPQCVIREPDTIEENRQTTSGTNLDIVGIEGNDQLELARCVARYLSAKPDDNQNITLLCPDDSQILDGMLSRYGFGKVGKMTPSTARQILAILPLVLELAWEPFRPDRLLDLLQLPDSPVPATVRYKLIRVITEVPGIMSEEWNNAWDEAKASLTNKQDITEKQRQKNIQTLTDVRAMLENKRFSPKEGIPLDDLLVRCDWLAKILRSYMKSNNDNDLKVPLSHIKILKEITKKAKAANRSHFTRVELLRILDSITETGTTPAHIQREVTPFEIITDPGMITHKTETLLWFDFVRTDQSQPVHWSSEERTFFEQNHVYIDPTHCRKLDTWLLNNAMNQVTKRLILFIPKFINGEEVFYHPFLYDLAAAKNSNNGKLDIKSLLIHTEKLTAPDGTWKLADRELKFEAIPIKKEFDIVDYSQNENGERVFTFPGTAIELSENISFYELKPLLSCPFCWMINYYLGLKKDSHSEIPTDSLVYGNLTHKIFETLFKDFPAVLSMDVEKRAGELFDTLVSQRAAELNYPEKKAFCNDSKQKIIDSADWLVKEFQRLHITKMETELSLQQDDVIDGQKMNGRLDLVAIDEQGKKYVVDYKWSTGTKYSDQKDPCHLQLATYIKLLGGSFSNIETQFYLVPKNRPCSGDQDSLEWLWSEAEKLLHQRREELQNGIVIGGVEKPKKNDKVIFNAECTYCNLMFLCGKKETQNESN